MEVAVRIVVHLLLGYRTPSIKANKPWARTEPLPDGSYDGLPMTRRSTTLPLYRPPLPYQNDQDVQFEGIPPQYTGATERRMGLSG